MARVKLTAARVRDFTCEPGKQQSFLWDSEVPGLALRATAKGAKRSKSFIFQARLGEREMRITIGSPADWGITDAREEARRLQRLIDAGRDPREEKKAATEADRAAAVARRTTEKRNSATVAEVWRSYLDAHKAKWSERHYQDHVNLAQAGGDKKKRGKGLTVAGPLAPLMPLKLSDLAPERVATWLRDEAEDRPTNAEQSYRKLRAFIRWCDEHAEFSGLVPANVYSARSVRDAVPRPKAKDDCLQREQLRPWFESVCRIANPVISSYLQALLLTGARREEMAALRWDDVDFRWGSLHLSDKVETETGRVIPLTPYLASLLLELRRINETPPNVRQMRRLAAKGETWEPSPWVFSSKTAADGKLAEPRIAHHKALDAAALPRLSLHGLRRSFGTLAEWCEVPVGVVAQIQGHKPSALAEKHYRRRPLDLLRMWHERVEAWILAEAKIDFKPEEAQRGLRAVP
ncbi:tyrosine-type recombinase/integrase [Paraburkholderia flagellata]|uniref:tyrosine-type recombinase/integrase n=1 Tax=Paraburkholderia flagellata TaxID=2883241 RepID=UPI001F23C675|nr:integrase family protein [Paraburkholderia flagellata]